MLKITNLCKKFDSTQVLQNVSLEVQQGSIFAMVGPNGAGKTTLIRTIMGIVLPDSGSIEFQGEDLHADPHLKGQIAYIPELHHFYPDFTGKQLAQFYRMTYSTWDEQRYLELRDVFKLPDNKKFKNFSKGMKTQMAFLLNLSINPRLLILDEPTSGLDPIVRKQVLNLIVDLVASQGTTVIISSHKLLELERICDSFGILSQGKLLLSDQIDILKQEICKVQVAFEQGLPEEIALHPSVLSCQQVGHIYTLILKDSALQEMIEKARPSYMGKLDISMEEIFMSVMGGYQNA